MQRTFKRESKGLEIVGREAFEAPNRGDTRERVRTHESTLKEIQLVFFSSPRLPFLSGVCRLCAFLPRGKEGKIRGESGRISSSYLFG